MEELDPDLESWLNEKRKAIAGISEFLRGDAIVEFGCGSGFVIENLKEIFPDARIIGIDLSEERLGKVNELNLDGVTTKLDDFAEPLRFTFEADSAIFSMCLHEIFSYHGFAGLKIALANANDALVDGGRLAILEFMKPLPQTVTLKFKDNNALDWFLKFARDFKPRTIEFTRKGDEIRLDIAEATEFVSKFFRGYDCYEGDDEHWLEEMAETHFAFTRDEITHLVEASGFRILDIQELTREPRKWESMLDSVDFEFKDVNKKILLVAEK